MADLWKYTRTQSDTDASTFFAACVTAGTTLSGTQQTAIYGLVQGLKQTGLWSKMTALYPFVGGTAGCHAINLKSPGTYNITWSGTVTHNSNGITGNGSTGYGDTGLNANTVLSATSNHVSIYSRTNSLANTTEIGCLNSSSLYKIFAIYAEYSNSTFYTSNGQEAELGVPATDSLGFMVGSRVGASSVASYKRGIKVKAGTNASTGLPSLNVCVLAQNFGGTNRNFSSRNLSFASIGSGLTDSDASNLSLLVQSYQSVLGRAV